MVRIPRLAHAARCFAFADQRSEPGARFEAEPESDPFGCAGRTSPSPRRRLHAEPGELLGIGSRVAVGSSTRVARSAVVVAAVLAMAAANGAAHAAQPRVLHPGQQLHVAGTRIYCGVKTGTTGVLTTCVVVKTGTQTPEGYAVGIGDRIVGATHFAGTSAPVVFVRAQPAVGKEATAKPGAGQVTVKLGDKLSVAGTHVLITVSSSSQAGTFLTAWVADANGQPVEGSYLVGINERAVNVQQWQKGKTKPAYTHAQPGR